MSAIIRAGIGLSFFTLVLSAQGIIPILSQFPPQLKQYLELSDEQVRLILDHNSALQRFQAEKTLRLAQVQFELTQETIKPTPDPMAIGLRHVEMEAIRRELQAEQGRTATRIEEVLTAAQKTKLQALRQAIQLQPVICEAQIVNLLPSFPGNIVPAIVNQQPLPGTRLDPNPFFFVGGLCGNRSGSFANFLLGGQPTTP
jgi:hypothetical protein